MISTSQDLQTHLKVALPLTGVSNTSIESKTFIFNPNAKAKDDAMNECDALVSMRTQAHELNTRTGPRTTEVFKCCFYCPIVPDSLTADIIA